MKAIVSILALLVIAVLGYGAYKSTGPAPEAQDVPSQYAPVGVATYDNAKYGIAFTYPKKYRIEERLNPGSEMREHYTITLIPADFTPVEGGEGPTTITFDVYQNSLDSQTTESWIRNSSQSNFKLSPEGRISTTTVDGSEALAYRWDGLYLGTTIAIAKPAWVYAFSVTYPEIGAGIVQDYAYIIQTVHLADRE